MTKLEKDLTIALVVVVVLVALVIYAASDVESWLGGLWASFVSWVQGLLGISSSNSGNTPDDDGNDLEGNPIPGAGTTTDENGQTMQQILASGSLLQ